MTTNPYAEAVEAAARRHASVQYRSVEKWDDLPAVDQEAMGRFVAPLVAAAVGPLLAPIRALHQPEERCHDGEGTWSVTREVWETDFRGHDWLDDPEVFLVCAECGGIEMHVSRGEEHGDSHDYLDALWPCPTAKALDAIEGARDE